MLFLKQTKLARLWRVLLPLALVLFVVGFIPAAQGVQRFKTIYTEIINNANTVTTSDLVVNDDAAITGDLDVDGSTTFDGAADFDSTVDFSGATVTGVSTSTLSSLTVTGDSVLSGTLAVTGTTELLDDLDMNAQPITNIGAAGTDFGTDGALTLAAGLTVSAGNSDLAGTLQYGAANLYPLGYADVNQQVVCGTTAQFTETLEVTPTGLTTVTYVLASQITTPAAGAVFLTVSDPTTSTFVLSSWESDYSAGTTGITAHYCAVGDQ